MPLNTGEIILAYPSIWPSISNTGSVIGGTGIASTPVSSIATGIFPTGSSSVPGGSSFVRYSKLFYMHTGFTGTGNNLSNPFLYITNEAISDQISIAPDPYWLGVTNHTTQTGTSAGRASLPDGLSSSHFSGRTASTPLRFNTTLSSGQSLGFWVKMTVPAGLTSRSDNSFDFVLMGDIV
jgi:hypothetical protein